MKIVEERAVPMIEPPFSRQSRNVTVVNVSTDMISPSVELYTIFNMVAMNYALVEKHGVILHVRWLNRNISRLSHHKEIACELDFNRWVGLALPFLLSAHHLIGAYFLTTEGDKRMRLLSRLYGIYICIPFYIHTE